MLRTLQVSSRLILLGLFEGLLVSFPHLVYQCARYYILMFSPISAFLNCPKNCRCWKLSRFSESQQASDLDSQVSFRRQKTETLSSLSTVHRHADFSRRRLWGFAINFGCPQANCYSNAEENNKIISSEFLWFLRLTELLEASNCFSWSLHSNPFNGSVSIHLYVLYPFQFEIHRVFSIFLIESWLIQLFGIESGFGKYNCKDGNWRFLVRPDLIWRQ